MDTCDRQHAARSALERQLRLARQGRSILHPFIGRSRRFEIWQHYPRNDAVDLSGHWQFYYHAHDRSEPSHARHPQEHGHIHLFRRAPSGRLSHLTGLALDARGIPLTWFATNQWVTGERWIAAPELVEYLPDFELHLQGPLAGAALWLADMVRVYAEPLRQMLLQRDSALQKHCATHAMRKHQAWADRSIAVWQSCPIRWPEDAMQAQADLTS